MRRIHLRKSIGGLATTCIVSWLGSMPLPAAEHATPESQALEAARHRQLAAATTSHVPVDLNVDLGNGIVMAFKLIPPGRFTRGPRNREIRISRPFYIGVYEVTQAQWEAVMHHNPSYFKNREDSPDRPVERISWNDITARFLPAIQERAPHDMRFRLPTEAEWEYACRADTTTPWSFGSRITPEQANTEAAGLRQTVPVGHYPPNAWGLYDMHGNVSEWCKDWFDPDYYHRAPREDPVNLDRPEYGGPRVLRGGSWIHEAYNTRAVERLRHVPDYRNITTGVRLVLEFNTNRKGS